MFSNGKMKFWGCFILLLFWQTNTAVILAQSHKQQQKGAAGTKQNSPTAVWETLVSAIERKDLNLLRTTFSSGMKDGGWSNDIYFPLAVLSINPAKREFQITKVEADEYVSNLYIRRIGGLDDFKITLVKEPGGWKFATRKELYAAFDREIKDEREGKNNALAPETLEAPISPEFGPESSGGVTRESPAAIAVKQPPDEKKAASNAPTSPAPVNNKSGLRQTEDGPHSLIDKLIQDKPELMQSKEPIVIDKVFSTPTATLKTIIATIAFLNLDVGNESYSAKVRDRFKNLPKGNAGSLALVLSSYQGQIIRDMSEIGDEQINDKTARVAVKSYVSGKWYWLSFVKEDGWKLDLEASDFIQKAQSQTTKFDELFFDLLDFANRFEK